MLSALRLASGKIPPELTIMPLTINSRYPPPPRLFVIVLSETLYGVF
jgi:hypothetical protein